MTDTKKRRRKGRRKMTDTKKRRHYECPDSVNDAAPTVIYRDDVGDWATVVYVRDTGVYLDSTATGWMTWSGAARDASRSSARDHGRRGGESADAKTWREQEPELKSPTLCPLTGQEWFDPADVMPPDNVPVLVYIATLSDAPWAGRYTARRGEEVWRVQGYGTPFTVVALWTHLPQVPLNV